MCQHSSSPPYGDARPYTRLADLFLLMVVHLKHMCCSESVRDDPWKLLVATMLLNVTRGRVAIPIFHAILSIYPSPVELADAPLAHLAHMLQPLGLFNIRAARLKELSRMYISAPPVVGVLHHSRVPKGPGGPYPPTPVSHLPGSGRYALDSYRIFCTTGHAWMEVMPLDKELKRYMVCISS